MAKNVDASKLLKQIQDALAKLNQTFSSCVEFMGSRLGKFKRITLGEQIAYPCLFCGVLLLFISLLLFVF